MTPNEAVRFVLLGALAATLCFCVYFLYKEIELRLTRKSVQQRELNIISHEEGAILYDYDRVQTCIKFLGYLLLFWVFPFTFFTVIFHTTLFFSVFFTPVFIAGYFSFVKFFDKLGSEQQQDFTREYIAELETQYDTLYDIYKRYKEYSDELELELQVIQRRQE